MRQAPITWAVAGHGANANPPSRLPEGATILRETSNALHKRTTVDARFRERIRRRLATVQFLASSRGAALPPMVQQWWTGRAAPQKLPSWKRFARKAKGLDLEAQT